MPMNTVVMLCEDLVTTLVCRC